MKSIFNISLFLLLTITATAQKYDLKLNLSPGQRYNQSMVLNMDIQETLAGQEVNITSKMRFAFAQVVTSITPSGDFVIENQYTHIAITMDAMGTNISYDSDIKDTTGGDLQNKLGATFGAMLNKKFSVTLSPKGKVIEITGLKELLQSMPGDKNDPMTQKMIESFLDEKKMKASYESSYNIFPERSVKAGESWKKKIKVESMIPIEIDAIFTLEEVSNNIANIALKGDIKMKDSDYEVSGIKMKININGSNDGTYHIDMKTGMSTTANLTMPMKGTMEVMGMQMPISINSSTDITTTTP